jgi:hypothetical protein
VNGLLTFNRAVDAAKKLASVWVAEPAVSEPIVVDLDENEAKSVRRSLQHFRASRIHRARHTHSSAWTEGSSVVVGHVGARDIEGLSF